MMDNNKTVWVANYAGHDYKKAEKFGTIKFITKGYVSFGNLERLKYLVTEALKDSKEDDYLLLSGASSICVLSAIVTIMKHGQTNLLVYDKKADDGEGDYNELPVTVDNMEKLIDVVKSPV
jgi:hypothetical protein